MTVTTRAGPEARPMGVSPCVDFTPGNIALIDRGVCSFLTKVTNAEAAGAAGVIIANNLGDTVLAMGGGGSVSIPSGMIGQSDGNTIKGALPGVRGTITLPLPLTLP